MLQEVKMMLWNQPMHAVALGALALAACNGGITGPDDKDGDTVDIPELEIPDPGEIPSDVFALMGPPDDCADSQYWDSANMATTFFGGEFLLGDDSLVGAEYWAIYPNSVMQGNGYIDCAVRWDVAGAIGERVKTGDYSITINADVDLEYTNCLNDATNTPIYVGEESYQVTYDVLEVEDGTVRLYYTSGTLLGEGTLDNGRMVYATKKNCKAF